MGDISHLSSKQAFLQYWQHALFRENCNQLDFSFDDKVGRLAATESILSGQLHSTVFEHWFQENQSEILTIWIGFDVAQREHSTHAYLVPLWIPACITRSGILSMRSESSFPWVPSVLLDPLSSAPLLGLSPQLDEACDSLFQKNKKMSNWSDFSNQAIKLIERISGEKWRDKIIDAGFHFLNQSIVLLENKITYPVSPLFERFVSLEEQPFQEEFVGEALMQTLPQYPGIPYQDEYLAEEDLKAFLHVSLLDETQLLSLTTPAGSHKQTVIWNLLVNQALLAALNDKPMPYMVYAGIVAPDFNIPTIDLIVDEAGALKAQLVSHYAILKAGLNYVREYQQGFSAQSDLEQSIESIQKEDQALEEKADQLNSKLNDWHALLSKITLLQKMWQTLSGGKRHQQRRVSEFYENHLKSHFELDDTPLEEQIVTVVRSIKVQRTKLHNQLMGVTDTLTRGRGAHKQIIEWFKTNLNRDIELIDQTPLSLSKEICEGLGGKTLQYLASYWQAKGQPLTCSVQTLSEFSRSDAVVADWLMIDHAEQVSPMRMATLLDRTKRLFVMGDMANQMGAPLIPRRMDDYDIKQLGLAHDDDALEDLQFKGMTSTSSTFELVQDKSAFKRMAAHGLLAQNELKLYVLPNHSNTILTYANRCVYAHKLQGKMSNIEGKLPEIGYYHIRTSAHAALLDWIKQSGYTKADIGIVTLFEAQKTGLKESMDAIGIEIRTIAEASDFSRKIILFVPGYTLFDKKPYAFDQGEQLFNRAFLCAHEHFLVFGDMAIFDSKTHSPSGNVAKMIFKLSPMPLFILPEATNVIQGEAAHLEQLRFALKADHAVTIVSQGLDIKSVQKSGLDAAFQHLRQNQVRVTLYIGTSGLMGQGLQSKAFKHQLNIWQNLGISIFLVRNLHSNALWWDDHHYIEGQCPWLAGFGKLAKYPFVSQVGDDKMKTSFQSYLSVHSLRSVAVVPEEINTTDTES